ncbi:formate dehydrogenase accessory sulfurtransferase FdhD [Maridesulfovibrio zosterae]|uniref:formate dehydrogenase accessory sulfurtransferase FdhD n=1 Tax=Maridesulfovibrio zosterae TaxID=82171 RepID=UPI00040973C8|nr:formate dehydrogenase accessory sulfurtransferase FdhD [Maridesulfovibrio zosterae]
MPTSILSALNQTAPTMESYAEQRECIRPLQRYNGGMLVPHKDTIAIEEDLIVKIQDRPDMVLSRTPGDDLSLIMGHLFCNSLLNSPDEVTNISTSYQDPNRVDVSLDGAKHLRRVFPSSSDIRIAPERLFELKKTFERRQKLFKKTGSSHAAALFSIDGVLLAFGEDVGRHNAFDKAIGRALSEGTLKKSAIAMISSRIAVELAAKATTANIPILCGFSAATSSGVSYAINHNMTLIGRLKDSSFDVYANAWRIQDKCIIEPLISKAVGYAPTIFSGSGTAP